MKLVKTVLFLLFLPPGQILSLLGTYAAIRGTEYAAAIHWYDWLLCLVVPLWAAWKQAQFFSAFF